MYICQGNEVLWSERELRQGNVSGQWRLMKRQDNVHNYMSGQEGLVEAIGNCAYMSGQRDIAILWRAEKLSEK